MTRPQDSFVDAFLDTDYLKIDQGVLSFIFTAERVEKALEAPPARIEETLQTRREELTELYTGVTRGILRDAFYDRLFEQLSELDDDLAFAFIHLALGRIEDERIEAARVAVVREFQQKRDRRRG